MVTRWCLFCRTPHPETEEFFHGLGTKWVKCKAKKKSSDALRKRVWDSSKTIKCSKCSRELVLSPDNFYNSRGTWCKPCFSLWHKEYHRKAKEEVVGWYGGKCSCCGEDNISFLTIDHVGSDGGKHRKSIGDQSMVQWVHKNGKKDYLQILCFNCNLGRSIDGGVCPHVGRDI